MGQIVNKAQLSAIIGKSERTLTEYQKEPGFPIKVNAGRGGSNQYDTEEVIEWLIQRAVGGERKESSLEKLNRVRAQREELGLARDIGELIPAAETREVLIRVATAIRSTLVAGNSKLKAELDTLYDVEIDITLLHEHSRDILSHLAELNVELGDGDTGGAGGIPAAADDGHEGLG